MTRNEVLDDARDTLSVEADCPFAPPSDALVLRCPANRKWFAILLRRAEGELLCIRTGALTGSLLTQPGFVPAYHMNKQSWIGVPLNDPAMDEPSVPCCRWRWTPCGRNEEGKRKHKRKLFLCNGDSFCYIRIYF